MRKQIVDNLERRFESYSDLALQLDGDLLGRKPDVARAKSLAEHLWCVIGARESYAAAITQGSWSGFACSLQRFGVSDFQEKLAESAAAATASIEGVSDWTDERCELLATLAEHEVMHEGQIIRHMYALERELPASWVWA